MTTEQIEQQAPQAAAAPTISRPARPAMQRSTIGLGQIAERMGIHYETARRWAIEGRLPVFKYNGVGHWRAHIEQVDEFIEKHKNKAATWSEE